MSEHAFDEVIKVLNTIKDKDLRESAVRLHEDNRHDMLLLPSSIKYHHAYPGGYIVHVKETVEGMVNLMGIYPGAITDTDEAIVVAAVHDLDKLSRYVPETPEKDPPTDKQVSYAKTLGISLTGKETKAIISSKIDAKKNGGDPDEFTIGFKYSDMLPMESSGYVVRGCAKYGIMLSDVAINAITFHHGGWAEYQLAYQRNNEIAPLGILLHMADLASARLPNTV